MRERHEALAGAGLTDHPRAVAYGAAVLDTLDVGAAAAETIVLGVALVFVLRDPSVALGAAFASAAKSLLPAFPGAVGGSALGVWWARTMGSRRSWVAGAMVGTVLAALTIAIF